MSIYIGVYIHRVTVSSAYSWICCACGLWGKKNNPAISCRMGTQRIILNPIVSCLGAAEMNFPPKIAARHIFTGRVYLLVLRVPGSCYSNKLYSGFTEETLFATVWYHILHYVGSFYLFFARASDFLQPISRHSSIQVNRGSPNLYRWFISHVPRVVSCISYLLPYL